MNQSYAEAGVKRKDTPKSMMLRALMIFGVFIGLILLLLGKVFSILGVVIIAVLIFMFPRLKVEYEYIFVDGQIDFDRITGNTKRKTLLRIDFEQVEIMAPANSHALDPYNNIQCVKKDFTSADKDGKVYTIIATADSKKMRISFEPDENMVNMIRQKSPRKVAQY